VELFVHFDITRFPELVDLNAQVAGSGIGLLAEKIEIGFLELHQQADNGKPQLRM
jgi:hypothetical protein